MDLSTSCRGFPLWPWTLAEALRTELQFGHSPLHCFRDFPPGTCSCPSSSVLQLELLPGDTRESSPELARMLASILMGFS